MSYTVIAPEEIEDFVNRSGIVRYYHELKKVLEGPISDDPDHPSNNPNLFGIVYAEKSSHFYLPIQIIWMIYDGKIPDSFYFDEYAKEVRTNPLLIKFVEKMPDHFNRYDNLRVKYIDKKYINTWSIKHTPDDWEYEYVDNGHEEYVTLCLKDEVAKRQSITEFQKWLLTQENIPSEEKCSTLFAILSSPLDEQITQIQSFPGYGELYFEAKRSFEGGGGEEGKEAESSDEEW
jgi:hypothetical protein